MKIDKNSIFILFLIFMRVSDLRGMEPEEKNVFPLKELPLELQNNVFAIALNNEINDLPDTAQSFSIAVKKIRDFASIDTALNASINQPEFCLQLIKNLSKKFPGPVTKNGAQLFAAPNMKVAKALGIKCAQERYRLQDNFMKFIQSSIKSSTFSIAEFDAFIKLGVDIDFTYEYGLGITCTPLFYAVSQKNQLNTQLIQALINKGANVMYQSAANVPNILDAVLNQTLSRKFTQQEAAIDVVKLLLIAGAHCIEKFKNTENDILKEAQRQLAARQKK